MSCARISPLSAPFAPRRRPRSRRTSTAWRGRAARTAFPRSALSPVRWSSGWRPSRLRAIASGVDAVVAVERVAEDLPRYARALARIGPPPSTVLLVEHEAESAAAKTVCLEAANIRVVRCALAQAVQELLEREVPDL